MKKWIMILLFLTIPMIVWAQCENPLGKTYVYDGVTIRFIPGYQQDTIAQINVAGGESVFYHYIWDAITCRATLLSESPIYLDFDESYFDISENPFRFAVVGSTD